MAKTITSANAIFMISITNLIPAPVQLQGFAADDIFDTEPLEAGEFVMGVDGKLSMGFVYSPLTQNISLQSDSASVSVFDTWYAAERSQKDKFYAQGTVVLQSLGMAFILNNGGLRTYPIMPSLKKTIAPRVYGLTWESVKLGPI